MLPLIGSESFLQVTTKLYVPELFKSFSWTNCLSIFCTSLHLIINLVWCVCSDTNILLHSGVCQEFVSFRHFVPSEDTH